MFILVVINVSLFWKVVSFKTLLLFCIVECRKFLLLPGLLIKRSTCLYSTRDRLKFVEQFLQRVCEVLLKGSLFLITLLPIEITNHVSQTSHV